MTSTGAGITMARKCLATVLAVILVACTTSPSPLDAAGANYRQHRDYESLEIVTQHLSTGLSRGDVERLLGEPDYSPTEGLYYYSSAKKARSEQHDREVTLGLVVDYRDKSGADTKSLQKYQLGPMGE
jgi:hypothetical protein